MVVDVRTKAPKDPELAARRLKALLEEMEKEHGNRAKLSDRTGLSRSYINKILQGERTSVGQGAIDTVREHTKVSEEFFTAGAEGRPYRDFIDEFDKVDEPNVTTVSSNAHVAWLFGPTLDFGLGALRNLGPNGWIPTGGRAWDEMLKGEMPGFALTVGKMLRSMPMLQIVDEMEAAAERGDRDLVLRLGGILGELSSIIATALADAKVAKLNAQASELVVEAHDLATLPPEKRPREPEGPEGMIARFAREQRELTQKKT